jgi:hypothetical protein
MANVKKGLTVPPPEWWKHLKWCKRLFWKQQRRADKMALRRERDEAARRHEG